MAGYNTVTELLSLGVPGVLVPRINPSQEQWIRATRLEQLGLFNVIHPDQYSPRTLRTALDRALAGANSDSVEVGLDMNALETVNRYLDELMVEHDSGGWKKLKLQNVTEFEQACNDSVTRPLALAAPIAGER